MKTSVIIPVHNRSATIERAVESVRLQTRKPNEVIIVDDGSTDGTAEVCDRLAASDLSIRVIRQKNRGAGPARNNGIRASEGGLILFLDSDDEWLPGHVEKSIDAFHHGAEFIFSRCVMAQEGERPQSGAAPLRVSSEARRSKSHILSNFSVKTSSLAVARSLLDRLEYLFIEEDRSCEDYEFIWRAAAIASKIEAIDEELCIIWLTAGGESRRRREYEIRLDHVHAMATAANSLARHHADSGAAGTLRNRASWEGRILVREAVRKGSIGDIWRSIVACSGALGFRSTVKAVTGALAGENVANSRKS